jgi:hypothetical protein
VEPDSRRAGRGRQTLLTARDLSLLDFVAQHRLILAAHAQSLLGVSPGAAQRRLRALANGGYVLTRRVFAGQPACYQLSRAGLAVVGSDLPPPRLDLRSYAHDVGMAWLWLAAQRGRFGPVSAVLTERTLRSADARAAAAARAGVAPPEAGERLQPYGIRLGGTGQRGRERLHYPDLLLITRQGQRIAVELELTSKGQARRERILAGYGSDARVSTVLYLVDRPDVGRAIEKSARRLGIESLVHVQRVRQTLPPPGMSAARTAERALAPRSAGYPGAGR